MEFFYRKKLFLGTKRDKKSMILCISPQRFLKHHSEQKFIDYLGRLRNKELLFAITSLDGVSNLLLYSILNLQPKWVGVGYFQKNTRKILSTEHYKQLLTLIGAFNINVDVGGLRVNEMVEVIKYITKPFVITNHTLSGFVDSGGMASVVEGMVSSRKSLIILNSDNFAIAELADAIMRFRAVYGVEKLAVTHSKRQGKMKRLKKVLTSKLTTVEMDKIFNSNYNKYFYLSPVEICDNLNDLSNLS